MNPLKTCQQMLTWVFINPSGKILNKREKKIRICVTSVSVLCTIGYFVFSVNTFFNIWSTNKEMSFYVLSQIMITACPINIMVAGFFLQHKMVDIFKHLSEIYKSSKYTYKCIMGPF